MSFRAVSQLHGHKAAIRCLDIQDITIASGSDDGTVRLWDSRTHRVTQGIHIPHHRSVERLLISNYNIYAMTENNIHIFDRRCTHMILKKYDQSHELMHKSDLVDMSLSSNRLYFCDERGVLYLFAEKKQIVDHLHSSSCMGMVASDDYIYTIGLDDIVVRYSIEHRRKDQIQVLDLAKAYASSSHYILPVGPFNPPHPFSISIHDDNILALGLGNGMILIIQSWKSENSFHHQILHSNAVHSYIIGEVDFIRMNSGLPLVLSADLCGTLAAWDIANQQQSVICTTRISQNIHAMKVHPANDSTTIVIGGESGGLLFYSIL